MAEPTADPQVREALTELELYLSDTVPPLVVADSAELLLRYPPEIVAAQIRSWTGGQFSKGPGASIADYLFHAITKIHMLGEFKLVNRAALETYLQGLKTLLLAECPEHERELLRENLERLGQTNSASTAAPVASLHRQAAPGRGPAGSAAAPAPAMDERRERRIALFLDRLEAQARTAGSAPAGQAGLSQTLAAAASQSQTAREIEQYIGKLREMGVTVGTNDLFRALASSLPAWNLPASAPQWGPGASESPAAQAMQRMVVEAEDPQEGGRRFQQLVRAAVDRFNEGSLAQAVSTLELAEKLIVEKKVDAATVELARRKGDEALDMERLKVSAESPAQHAGLRKILNFFAALSPDGLLQQLAQEPKRERRRILLALIEAHGQPARTAALAALTAPFKEDAPEEWYFRRNLLYILRKIGRPADEGLDREAEATARHAQLRFPPPLVREAVANLAQLRHEKSEAALKQLLTELEKAFSETSDSPESSKELTVLLDRVAGALGRQATPGAWRALVAHALRKDPKLGDTMARLSELATQDLSEDKETVDRLLGVLKANLPFKLFGLALHQNDLILHHTLGALSSTPAPAVRSALEQVVSRFPDKEIAKAATKVLAGFQRGPAAAPAPPEAGQPAGLSGDLEIFGLPALLQSLSDSGLSGSLTLRNPRGEVFGAMRLRGGKLRACQTGALSGDDAFFQLFERPAPGVFQFLKAADPMEETGTGTLKEILPLTMEAMRRYDELKEASVLVPDGVRLVPTQVRPAPHPSEKDGMLMKALWTRVSRGATPLECEADVRTDAYRIRKLLAHWVEQGALQAAS